MKISQAEKILNEEENRQKEVEKAKKVIEEDKKQKQLEKEQAEKELKKKEYDAMKARFSDKPCEVFTKCWKCKKLVEMEDFERCDFNGRILLITPCQKCGNFNVLKVETAGKPTVNSVYYKYLKNF